MNSKIKKFFLATSTLGVMVGPVASAVSCGNDDKKVEVGATVWKADDPFMSVVKQGFEKGSQITGVKFSWVDGENDQTKINDKVTALINSGVKALAINLVDPSAAQQIIDKAKARGLPLILYNKEPGDTSVMASYNKVWYVGTRSRESGEMQVVNIANAIKDGILKDRNKNGKLEYFIINGEPGHQDAMARTEAVREDLPEELAKSNYQTDITSFSSSDYLWFNNQGATNKQGAKWAVHKVTKRVYIVKGATAVQLAKIHNDIDYKTSDPANTMYNTTDWQSAKGKEIAKPKIASMTTSLDFIPTNNDGTALGAVAAAKEASFVSLDTKLKAQNYAKGAAINYMPIFGIDATDSAKSSIKAGWLTGTVLNDGINQGIIAMLMAVNSYKRGTSNADVMHGIDAAKYSYTNELSKPTKAIRVAYKIVYRDHFDKFK